MAFWYTWESWVVELLGGASLGLLNVAVLRNVPLAALVATLFSCIYERWIDINGWSWKDVGQRSVGIAAGLALAYALDRLFLHGYIVL